jgi:hypothetical protein
MHSYKRIYSLIQPLDFAVNMAKEQEEGSGMEHRLCWLYIGAL